MLCTTAVLSSFSEPLDLVALRDEDMRVLNALDGLSQGPTYVEVVGAVQIKDGTVEMEQEDDEEEEEEEEEEGEEEEEEGEEEESEEEEDSPMIRGGLSRKSKRDNENDNTASVSSQSRQAVKSNARLLKAEEKKGREKAAAVMRIAEQVEAPPSTDLRRVQKRQKKTAVKASRRGLGEEGEKGSRVLEKDS